MSLGRELRAVLDAVLPARAPCVVCSRLTRIEDLAPLTVDGAMLGACPTCRSLTRGGRDREEGTG